MQDTTHTEPAARHYIIPQLVTVDVDRDTLGEAEEAAADLGVTLSGLAERLLAEWVAKCARPFRS